MSTHYREKRLQQIGSFYHGERTDFVVWAPLKESVRIHFPDGFSDDVKMQKDGWGYWKTSVEVKPGQQYTFQVNGEAFLPDPASVSQPGGVHSPSEIVDRHFSWTDDSWPGLELGEMIIYELHVGTFTEEGKFTGIEDKLDYLIHLGINTIEIMPVAQFPGERNWGYDSVFPFCTQNSYGGSSALKRLINACHGKNLAVILDVIYNHLGPEGNYLEQFAPYFTDKYNTFWGKSINFDDAWCDGVRNYFIQNALMWLDEYHVDALRLDAVHAIWDFSALHFTRELKEAVESLAQQCGKKKVLIAEIDLNNPRYIDPQGLGGYGLDGQWADEFHHALHTVITGERSGYYEDFGKLADLEKAFRASYVYDGIYSPHRKKIFGADVSDRNCDQFVVFSQNHDQVGNRLGGERIASLVPFEKCKLAAAALILSPYVPLLFMGEEYGEKNPFLYFIHHGDPGLIETVRESRKKEFAYFHFEGDFVDPQAEETFLRSKLSWNITEESTALLNFYTFLITLRKTRAAMKGRSRESLLVKLLSEQCLRIERMFSGDQISAVLNFGDSAFSFTEVHNGQVHLIADSSSTEWKGENTDTKKSYDAGEKVIVAPESVLIFETNFS
jgi:maltooligosyltrehalose trehalohydrolase